MDNSGRTSEFNIETPVFEAPRPIIPDEQMMPDAGRDVSQIGNVANIASFGNTEMGMQMGPQVEPQPEMQMGLQAEQPVATPIEPMAMNQTPVNNVANGESIEFDNIRTNKNGLDKKGLEQVTKMLNKFEKNDDPFSLMEDYEKAVEGNLKNSFNRVIGGEKAA